MHGAQHGISTDTPQGAQLCLTNFGLGLQSKSLGSAGGFGQVANWLPPEAEASPQADEKLRAGVLGLRWMRCGKDVLPMLLHADAAFPPWGASFHPLDLQLVLQGLS